MLGRGINHSNRQHQARRILQAFLSHPTHPLLHRALSPMLVDGNGVALMCSIMLPGRQILLPSQALATVGVSQAAQVRDIEGHFCPVFSIPSPAISGSDLQGILLGWNYNIGLSSLISTHLFFLSILFPWGGTPVKMREGLWSLTQNLGFLSFGFSRSTSPIDLSSSVSSGYLKWIDHNCYLKLPYVCKFKD